MKTLLQRYPDNLARLRRLQQTDCTLSDVVRGSYTDAPYTMHSVRIRGIDREKWNHVQERIQTLAAQCRAAEETVADAPESLRPALRAHFLRGRSWGEVGEEMGIHPNTLRKRAEKYLATLEKQN